MNNYEKLHQMVLELKENRPDIVIPKTLYGRLHMSERVRTASWNLNLATENAERSIAEFFEAWNKS